MKNIKTKRIFITLFFTVIVILSLKAQQTLTVTGKILDENNTPLAGATIVVEGTTNGTISSMDGNFMLDITGDKARIQVSFIGYTSQYFDITENVSLTIKLLPDFQKLDEIVVVGIGYGTMRKSDLTGAIASVKADDMKKGVISSTEQLLQGKIAGLTVVQGTGDPASGASLRLRGGTSLTASNGPLIVVDGIPGVDLNTIQPSEIASIDVLKDASSAAIYGSRGANGVIIVTTNRETKGQAAEYKTYLAIGTVANHLDLLSANQWRKYVRDDTILNAVDYGAVTDWQKELEQTAITQSHALSFSNGDSKGGYRASISYLNNEGVIKTSRLQRIGASLTGFNYVMNDKLKLDAGLHTNFDEWNPIDNRIFERMYNLNPTIPVFNPDGTFTSVSGTNYENPVEINTNRTNVNSRNRLLGYGKAELEIITGLKADINLSYEYNSMKGRLYKPSYAVMEGVTDKGYAQRSLGDYTNKQIEMYLTYDKALSEIHKINVVGGYSFLENMYEGFGAERRGFNTDLFLYNNLASGQDFRAGDVYSYKGTARLISFFGRINYSIHSGKYAVTATLRRDGSSRFGANHKWGYFPSASLAWRISDESFMSSTTSWLNNLKLRAGYGVTGNQDGIGEYKSLSILGAGGDSYYDATTDAWKQSYGPIQNPNPDLKWESTSQINIGLDFGLINRVNGTLELYKKMTSDLLYTYAVPQPPYLVGTMLANVGDLSNKGIELTLNSYIIQTQKFSWDIYLVFAANKQVIEKLSNQVYTTEEIYTGSLHNLRGMSNQFAQVIKEGYPVGSFWGPEFGELNEEGKFLDQNGNLLKEKGKTYPDSLKTYLGNAQPKFTMGLSTGLSYKQIDLDISTIGMFGQKVLNATAMSLSDPSRLPAQNVPDAFLESGIADDPTYSSYWIEDASFIRLQYVTLGYNFSIDKIGINSIKIYVTGENLFVFTNYTGIDPEVSIDGLSNPGIDMFNYYPKPRTISLGLNLTF
ncbi:MAG: TonB-dependent receptor [Bacteroidales bacterium]|nr:TonB-dependent receptor [Bacteroidales bacterium]